MAPHPLTVELEALRFTAEQEVERIKKLLSDLLSAREELRTTVSTYNDRRVALLEKGLSDRDLTWCTHCNNTTPKDDARLIFIEGRRKESGGYGDDSYGFVRFFKLHRMCPQCRQDAESRNGWFGQYDTMARDQESFNALQAEERNGRYYIRRGDWHLLEDRHQLEKLPNLLIERLSAEWGLPPQIKTGGPIEPESGFTICEQEASATK